MFAKQQGSTAKGKDGGSPQKSTPSTTIKEEQDQSDITVEKSSSQNRKRKASEEPESGKSLESPAKKPRLASTSPQKKKVKNESPAKVRSPRLSVSWCEAEPWSRGPNRSQIFSPSVSELRNEGFLSPSVAAV